MQKYSSIFFKISLFPILIIFFFLSILATSCQKELGVEDYPNLLLDMKLSTTDNPNEIAVSLSTSHSKVNYSIKKQNEDYRILTLNNTFKSSKLSHINIDGFKDYIATCKAVQINQQNDTRNPVITKLIFKVTNPEVKIVVKTKSKLISVTKITKIASESESASAIVASKMNNSADANSNLYILEFFGIIVVIVIIFWFFSKYETT